MNKILQLLSIPAAALAFAACEPDLKPAEFSSGGLDLSSYVAVGNSLTAGFADGTLYRSGQENSYPAMLAKQFAMVGGGDFNQPYLKSEHGYPDAKRVLGASTDCKGVTALGPVFYSGAADSAGDAASVAAQGPFNNVGVPGIRVVDMLFPGYGALNPYSKRFYASPATQRPLDELTRKPATFFTVWLGNNDVLGWATAGGEGPVGALTPGSISPAEVFAVSYDSVVNAMTRNGAKGVLINIPDITAVPYFTTVPPDGLTLDAATAAALTAGYAGTGITFQEGANNFIIQDPSVAGLGFRQVKNSELILLTVPQDSIKCAGWGSQKPIPQQFVLDEAEIATAQAATTTFNNIIKAAAQAHGLAYVDMNTYLRSFETGILFNGVTFTTTFVSGGTFSLDGIHLTPRGYALAANEILRSINSFYNANIPMIDVNSYNGVQFP